MTGELSPHVAAIVDEVMSQSHDRHDPEFVRDLVTRVISTFDGAPVQDYIDVLVIKQVADELRRLHASQPIAA